MSAQLEAPERLMGRFAALSRDDERDPGLLCIRDGAASAPLGAVRFGGDAQHRRVELQWTAPCTAAPTAEQRRVHVDAALLVLRYAFEELQCNRVALHCDARDGGARRFAQQLGFLYEATLEQHAVLSGAAPSDIAVHRILRHEWSAVSHDLHATLLALGTPSALGALGAAALPPRTAAAALPAPPPLAFAGEAGDLTEEEEEDEDDSEGEGRGTGGRGDGGREALAPAPPVSPTGQQQQQQQQQQHQQQQQQEDEQHEQHEQEGGGGELPYSPPAPRLPCAAPGHSPGQQPAAVALSRPRRARVAATDAMHGRTSAQSLLASVEQKGGAGGVCAFLGTFTLKRRRHEIARDFDSTRAALRPGAAEQQHDGRPLSLWPAVLLHTVRRLRSHHADSWMAQRGSATFPLPVQRCEEAGGPFEADLVYLLSHLLYLTGLVDGLDKTMAGAPQDIAACFAETVVRWLGGQCARRHAADLIERTLAKSDRFGSTKKRPAALEEQTPRKLLAAH